MRKERRICTVVLMSAMLVSACGKISLPTLLVIDPAGNNTMTIQLPASFGGASVTSQVVGNVKTTVIIDTNKLFTTQGTPATVRVDSFMTAGSSMNLGSIPTGTLCSYLPTGAQAGGIAYMDPLITQTATFYLTIPIETKSVDPNIQKLLPPIPLTLNVDAKAKITLNSLINLLLNGTGLSIHQAINATIPADIPLLGGSAVTLDTTMTSTKTEVTDPMLDDCASMLNDPDIEAHYVAVTDDGVQVQMRRYRPSTADTFRVGKQPVVLFSGILMNMNVFMINTPKDQQSSYSTMTLPTSLADWAYERDANGNLVYDNQGNLVAEEHIAEDPMKYYSLAFYLWLKGYDVWVANYRNTGHDSYRTNGRPVQSVYIVSLDSWTTLDAPAVIDKVRSITGIDPVIGGHSTGGFCSYSYLQGAYTDYGGATDKVAAYEAAYDAGYLPHVKGDAVLALLRNSHVKGFIALDPAGQPPMPQYLNTPLVWSILDLKIYIPMDTVSEDLLAAVPTNTLTTFVTVIFEGFEELNAAFTADGLQDNLFGVADFWNPANMDPYVEDFTTRYGFSSSSLRCIAQYIDNGLNECTREYWQNGAENKSLAEGPTPNPGNDGYYYYSQNMDKLTVPTIAILSTQGALVDPNIVISSIMAKKTPNPLDEIHIIEGTAHIDLVMGLKAPTEEYPLIGAWLEKVSPP